MLKSEILENGLIHHWAEQDGKRFKIKQIETGIIYDEAIDVAPCRYTYEETNEEVEIPTEEQNEE